MMETAHFPVMKQEAIEKMNIKLGGRYADLTFGEGGHAEAILDAGAGEVVAFDRDHSALQRYQNNPLKESRLAQLRLVHRPFSQLLEEVMPFSLEGILIDLGVSTKQILSVERGFSFRGAGPLDMRMDETQDLDLKTYFDQVTEEDLSEALRKNADMTHSRSLARRILEGVRGGTINSTGDLARLIPRYAGTHPATQLFMALRMEVNQELSQIEEVIPQAITALKSGGRLIIISFHSVEDRVVKRAFQKMAGRCICGERICACPREEIVKILTSKPVLPSAEELKINPRSRSAKLRSIEKL